MRHLRSISKKPALSYSLAPEVKITFIISILQASVPLFQNKNPRNPVGPGPTPPSDSDS
jgi:hypothetical protein